MTKHLVYDGTRRWELFLPADAEIVRFVRARPPGAVIPLDHDEHLLPAGYGWYAVIRHRHQPLLKRIGARFR